MAPTLPDVGRVGERRFLLIERLSERPLSLTLSPLVHRGARGSESVPASAAQSSTRNGQEIGVRLPLLRAKPEERVGERRFLLIERLSERPLSLTLSPLVPRGARGSESVPASAA
jgi:hypothetical protein